MNDDDINIYVPSLLNPRCVKKNQNISLTQNSIISRCSLSLKRTKGTVVKPLDKTKSNKENLRNTQISCNPPSGQKPQIDKAKKPNLESVTISENLVSHISPIREEKGIQNVPNTTNEKKRDDDSAESSFLEVRDLLNIQKNPEEKKKDDISRGFSFLDDLISNKDTIQSLPDSLFGKFNKTKKDICEKTLFGELNTNERDILIEKAESINKNEVNLCDDISIESFESFTSAAEINDGNSESTLAYKLDGTLKTTIQVSFGVKNTDFVDVKARNGAIKKFSISHYDKDTNIDCELMENSQISTESEVDENMNETFFSPQKRPAVAVNLEIKKQKLTHDDSIENSKVLILKTDAIEKISHVIVQPPNYKFVKRNLIHKSEYKKAKLAKQNGVSESVKLRQAAIDSFFRLGSKGKQLGSVLNDVSKEMSKNSGVIEAAKCDRMKRCMTRRDLEIKSPRRELNELPKSARLPSKKDITHITQPRRQDIRTSNSDAPSPRIRNESLSAHTPRKNVESLHFNLPVKSKSNRTSLSPRNIPHHKIVAGTHFAVDAFSYGDIPNVKHYFLTHFHSDHYSGLKKTFNKVLFCSKITADLCISRLGVNPKNIRVINVDEVLRIEGVEVAAVDANHCPGALMLIFTLPNGKTLLHTGDFRACPAMESYPMFWNKDIHTVYLDTTYCNPRYDFPTQDQSLEMALYILRQKKLALENAGKKFSSVLIVCGTYTIGKEKFFLGMSRRVGCAVWACPEKERVLQIVEGRACSRDPPEACQLHVVPMRDLTHEKLRSYLDSLQGAFSEVVAFKPSGWENGKNSSVEKDLVTIHGIPYSEHSSFSELIRFIKFLKPKQVVPTVDISGGVKSVQKYFPCPLVYKEELQVQAKLTDYYSIHSRHPVPAVT